MISEFGLSEAFTALAVGFVARLRLKVCEASLGVVCVADENGKTCG
jgi:hypothetical protein